MLEKPRNLTLDTVKRLFSEAGLPLPPIPSNLAPQLQPLKEWVFGTRFDTPDPYDFDWYVREYLSNAIAEDYLVFGHDGHGINSYALHYYLVRGPLAVFDQLAWGGVYTTNNLALDLIKTHFVQLQDMIEALDTALDRGLLDPNERFILVLSDFSTSRWTRTNAPLLDNLEWKTEPNSLLTLLSAVIEAQKILEP
jgi:hypothetical protein